MNNHTCVQQYPTNTAALHSFPGLKNMFVFIPTQPYCADLVLKIVEFPEYSTGTPFFCLTGGTE